MKISIYLNLIELLILNQLIFINSEETDNKNETKEAANNIKELNNEVTTYNGEKNNFKNSLKLLNT